MEDRIEKLEEVVSQIIPIVENLRDQVTLLTRAAAATPSQISGVEIILHMEKTGLTWDDAVKALQEKQ